MTQPPQQPPGQGGFPFPPPPDFKFAQQGAAGGGGAPKPMFTDNNMYVNSSQQQFYNAEEEAQRRISTVRRLRGIRGAMAVVSVACLAKIAMDAKKLYEEEKNLLRTLEQADRDCNNTDPIAVDPTSNNNAAAGSSSSSSSSSASSSFGFGKLAAIPQTSYADSYKFAASNFPMATVRAVLIRSMDEYEGRLASVIDNALKQKKQQEAEEAAKKSGAKNTASAPPPPSSNFAAVNNAVAQSQITQADLQKESYEIFSQLPRHVPARLFGNSIEYGLRKANLTEEAIARGVPCPSNAEMGVRSIDHFVLRTMLRIGQLVSFDGSGDIFAYRGKDQQQKDAEQKK